jgi:hypothetical protein
MFRLLALAGALSLAASGLIAGPKCDAAKAYLDENKASLEAVLTDQFDRDKIEKLGEMIEKNHEFLCGRLMADLKMAAEHAKK